MRIKAMKASVAAVAGMIAVTEAVLSHAIF